MARNACLEQETTATRQDIEAFISDLELKLALKVQKLGYLTLDKAIATTYRIECLQKEYLSPNMDSLESVLQDKLTAVCKKLKEVTSAVTEKVICIAQPSVAQVTAAAAMKYQYFAPSLMMNAPQYRSKYFLCDREGFFMASCPTKLSLGGSPDTAQYACITTNSSC